MTKYLIAVLLIFTILNISSCKPKNDFHELRKGTFELYEGNEKIGLIYRIDSMQIEEYPYKKDYLKVKIKWINDSTLYMNSGKKIRVGIDTITWLIQYNVIDESKKEYGVLSKAAYIDTLSYRYEARLIKISDTIEHEVLKILKK